ISGMADAFPCPEMVSVRSVFSGCPSTALQATTGAAISAKYSQCLFTGEPPSLVAYRTHKAGQQRRRRHSGIEAAAAWEFAREPTHDCPKRKKHRALPDP